MRISLFFLCFISLSLAAQNITIKGKAHASLAGKEVVLHDYTDYLSYTKTREAVDTIDANGYFELSYQSHLTKPVQISVGNLTGKLYIQPDFVYGIYFPEKDSAEDKRGDVEIPVDISVYSKDSTELNALIIDFNILYNHLFEDVYDNKYLSPATIYQRLDSLQAIARKRYKKLEKGYFKDYVEYSIATLNANASRNRNFLIARYINKKPVLYDNYEYMEFFNTLFKDYLKVFATSRNGGNIYNSINAFADYKDLWAQFKSDKLIANDTIRELVVLKGLSEFYYSPDFSKSAVLSLIEQFNRDTKIPRHQKMSQTLLQNIYQLQPGAQAPDFRAIDRTGKAVALSDFKGKFVYLGFFSTNSVNSLKEMPKTADLRKKYGDKVVFISISLDDSLQTFKNYLKANPKFDWTILFNNSEMNGATARDHYNVKGVPAFFFITPQGQLVQSPAPSPSEGMEYKFKGLFRAKRKDTIPGIR